MNLEQFIFTWKGRHLVLALFSSSIGIKADFLGERLLKELCTLDNKERQKHKVLKLRKISDCILADASCTWYLKICDEFTKLGVTTLKMDQGIFNPWQ